MHTTTKEQLTEQREKISAKRIFEKINVIFLIIT